MKDYYAILGLEKTASLRDIKGAYRILAKKYHPDVNKSAEAAQRMQSVNEAYAILGDPIRRAEYDQIREMGDGATQAAYEQHVHVACAKCGKVDSTLRVSTFTTVWSFLFFSTYRGWSQILCARHRVLESLKFNLQVLCFGWWGIPWGIIWTVVFFIKNALGGHQPRENNAILLATVGRNLINAGDYIEAEKALIESLKLRDNEYVQNLLRIAKSKSGFKREKSPIEKLTKLESHPLAYNVLLLLLLSISVFAAINLNIASKDAVVQLPKHQLTVEEQVAKDFGTDSETINKNKHQIDASNVDGMLHQSWLGKLAAKINIIRGERWSIPIHLGDTREHVYQILGDPSDNSDQYIAANEHLQKDIGGKDDTKFWMDKGIIVSFKDDVVDSITASGHKCATKEYNNPIVYGISSTDSLATLVSKLGTPYTPKAVSPDAELGEEEFEWRIGNLLISREFVTRGQEDQGKHFDVGYPWGGISIEDLTPILQEEKNRAEDAKIKNEKVALSGAQISAKEIYERYKDRVYLITSYNSKNEPSSFGTGFLYKNSYIITNYHVVEDARSIKVKPLHGKTEEEGAAVIYANKKSDWVVLDLFHNFTAKDPEPFPAVQLAAKAQTGDPVTVIGNPEGLTGSLTTGVVSSTRSEDGTDWIQISAPISHGSSGSPVFDGTGHWIGVATLFFKEGQNLNFATPSKQIVDQIESGEKTKQIQLPLKPPVSGREDYLEYIHKSQSDNLQERKEAIKGFNSLLDEYPDPSDQNSLLGDLADAYPANDIDDLLKIYDKQIALELDWNYFPLISKGDILWDLENKKSESEKTAQTTSTSNDSYYRILKNDIYKILNKHYATASFVSSIELKGGPDKFTSSWWEKNIIGILPMGEDMQVRSHLNTIYKIKNDQACENSSANAEHVESFKCYTEAIEMAKRLIEKDFENAKKDFDNEMKMNDIAAKNDHLDYSKNYEKDLSERVAHEAGDAYEIGYLYWMMENNTDAVIWLEKSKQMAPDNEANSKQCDKILDKIHKESQSN